MFYDIAVLDLKAFDGDFKVFTGGIEETNPRGPKWVGILQGRPGGADLDKLIRFNMATFGDIALDPDTLDGDLKGFNGSFTDGTSGYLVTNYNGDAHSSNVGRFNLATCNDIAVLQFQDLPL